MATPTQETGQQSGGRGRRVVVLLGLAAAAGIGYFVWQKFFAAPPVPPELVILSGRIEGDDSAISPKTAGRILELRVREGDTVSAGQVVAVLDDVQLRAREDQAQAALAAAEARIRSARERISGIDQQLNENRLLEQQARTDSSGRVRQAEAELAAAEASLAQAEAAAEIANFDRAAYSRLAKSGAVSERQGRQAETTAAQQAAAVAAARRRVESARGALEAARAALANPNIRGSQAAGLRVQMEQQRAEIDAAVATANQARAQLAEAQANRGDLTLTAPMAGTIITRAAEPGEMVSAGTPVVTILDLSQVYLRGFIPEGQIGRIKVRQAARVYLDSAPTKPVDAYVSRIDPQATFTPENTYFRDDRVRQVVGVKLQLRGAEGFAKPGMPADGEILAEGDRWPEYKRR